MTYSIVNYYGSQKNYRCGYCKNATSCQSNGMWAHAMTSDDYQELIDRGWRRSGSYCYKPDNKKTCCPQYTIKCDAMKFKLNKSHKKILKRMNKFLRDGIKDKPEGEGRIDEKEDCDSGHDMQVIPEAPDIKIDTKGIKPRQEDALSDVVDGCNLVKASVSASQISLKSFTGSSAPCKKAKLARIERKKEKLALKGLSLDDIMKDKPSRNIEKTLEDFLNEEPKEESAHKLKISLVATSNDFEFAKTLNTSFRLYEKYQISIHNDPPSNTCDYKDFLVTSPIEYTTDDADAPSSGFGSFHQQYWLDDKLIAVGVIDILPYCISSVYFFYDPDYSFLSLGTYASLREIAFTRELQKTCPDLSKYYMGFYIHSCPKMRYKGRLNPSYLLCPEVYSWHELNESLITKLDQSKYCCRFNIDPKAFDVNRVKRRDLTAVLVLKGRTYMSYSDYKEQDDQNDEDEIYEYANLVGKNCSRKMLLYRH